MKPVAVRTIKRTDADTTKALGHAGVSIVHEAQGRIGLMKPYMRPIYAGVGDLLAASARARGIVGLVIDGGTRDVADFDSLWIITFKNSRWAAQFRSSFAAS